MANGPKARSGRSVAALNSVVSVGLLAVIATVALVVNPPAPPGIAAFAPQASKPITKAPLGQSAENGAANGGAGCPARSCATPKPGQTSGGPVRGGAVPVPVPSSSLAVGVPSALQCASWPDGSVTQTFDPQSPPCIASWPDAAKGNGGATSPGVTSTQIRVAYPQLSSGSQLPALLPIVDFINSHFQLYGRKFVMVPYSSVQEAATSQSTDSDPQAQNTDAVAATTLKVFAATDFLDGNPTALELPSFAHTLAKKRIITVAGGETPPLVSSSQMAAHAPFEYSYSPTIDQLLGATASMVCRSLVGRPALHARDYRSQTRTFAVLIPESKATGGSLDGVSAMMSTLAGCGLTDLPVVSYEASGGNDASGLGAAMLKLKNDGITSLIYFPWWYNTTTTAPQTLANNVNYHPEWVTMSWQPTNTSNLTMNTASAARTFGVMGWNKLFAPTALPWNQAYTAGGSSTNGKKLSQASGFYHELLLLASGAQMAGPRLTPETFSSALRATTFPNPGAGTSPSYQGHVGFESGDGVMVDDFAGFWFNPSSSTATTTQENLSFQDPYDTYCYLDLGRRVRNAAWIEGDRYYRGRCD